MLVAARLGRGTVAAFAWLIAGSLGRAATAVLAFPLIVGLATGASSTWWYLLAFLTALVVGAVLDLRASTAAFEVGLGVASSHDSVLLERIRKAPVGWFSPEQRQRLEQMFASGSQDLAQAFAHLLAPLCDAVFTTAFIAVSVMLFSPGLGWVLLGLVALQLGGFVLQVVLGRRSERRWFESVERFSRALSEFSRLQPLLRLSAQGADARVLGTVERHREASLRLAVVSVIGHQTVTVTRIASLALIPLFVIGSLTSGAVSPIEAAALVTDVSFAVPAGTTLAIVGPSGSGKSTLLALIAGLLTPDSGTVSYHGVAHDVLGPAGIFERTSAVFQSIALTGDTILENVSAGRPGASLEECDEVAAAAQLTELIARLPRGWLTPVGEGGSQLSGGERQRVTLARALLKDAPILLLDEATSSLDTLTEAGFLTALEARRGRQTCVIVAHRLNTIASADRIVFLEGGVVRESGSLDELLALDGRFAAYWRQRQVAGEWALASEARAGSVASAAS